MKGRGRQPGQAFDATLAAIATLTAAWPISTLLRDSAWLRGTLLLLTVIVLSGIVSRSLALGGWQVLTVQLACSVLTAGTLYGRGHLWHGLPSLETLGHAGRLIREAVSSAQKYASPAPTTPGLIFVVSCSLAVAALAVDYLAVTRRSPSLAGLPLLTVFLAAVANRGSTMPAIFFVAAAAMWLVLVARSGRDVLGHWGTTSAVAQTPARQSAPAQGIYENASIARTLGALALAAAVVVPLLLPHPPPLFLASGLGRSSSGTGNGPQTVGFSQSLDLAADLKSRSRTPVLQYSTADTSPPPLRVAVGSYYRPEPGLWLPWGRPWLTSSGKPDLSLTPTVPEPTGLSPAVPKRAFLLNVRNNMLEDPFLAAPYPLVAADMSGAEWGADYQTQSIRVAKRPETYRIEYLRLEPTAAMLATTAPLTDRERFLYDLDLRLEEPYADRVTALTTEVTAGKTSIYDKAMAIQQYLRADGGFTYSLTLAPPARNQAGDIIGSDPLTNFLITKRGYCVQFATAMVMMSRAAGIPARMNIGFLPGTESKGVWTVLAADAHAWPELFLDGIGWTRFEPTPSSRAAPPAYAIPAQALGTTTVPAPGAAGAPVPRSAVRKDIGDTATGNGAAPRTGISASSVVHWLTHGWAPVLLGLLLILLALLVVPAAALWRRRRHLAAASTTAQEVEVRWEQLTSSLDDLGIAPAPSLTPRQQRVHYDSVASLEGADSQALGRVVQTLERSRYATSPPSADGLESDARRVLSAAAATRQGRTRLRATLWPSSGVTQLRSATAHVARQLRAPLRTVRNVRRRR